MKVVSNPKDLIKWIETPMSVSEFNDNTRFENIKAIINFILNLLFMRPGTIPELPQMGYDLRSRRHYLLTAKNLADQNEDLQMQMSTYIRSPLISSVDLYPKVNDYNGDMDTTVIEIKLITDEVVAILDDGVNTSISYKTKDFTK